MIVGGDTRKERTRMKYSEAGVQRSERDGGAQGRSDREKDSSQGEYTAGSRAWQERMAKWTLWMGSDREGGGT
jgi:hypothetical protein